MITDNDNLYKNERIRAYPYRGARHLYECGTDKGTVEVEAANRAHAVRLAEKAGYVVRDVNMVG